MALNFNGNTPKKILFNGKNVANLIFNNVLVWKSSLLPKEYQQVEYIESTGTQYIELNYKANQNTNSKGTFQITDISVASVLFGAREKSSAAKFYGFNWGGGEPYKFYNSYYTGQVTEKEIDRNKHTFSKNAGLLKIDDVEMSRNTPTVTKWNTVYNMAVFGCITGGSIGLFSKARIFDLQFSEGDEIKYNLIPCYRKSDNEIGLYDLVTKTFYTNLGSGEFIKGNNI